MILVTSRQFFADFRAVHRFSCKRQLLILLSSITLFSSFTEASTYRKIIETGKITMTGNRQTETDKPRKRAPAFREKITVTSPIVFTGTRKKSP